MVRTGAMVGKKAIDMATGKYPGSLVSADQHDFTAVWPEEILRLVLNQWSIEDSLQNVGDRSSDEDIHTLVLERYFQPRCSCPCDAKLCCLPTGDHCLPLRRNSLEFHRPGSLAGYNALL